MSRHPTHAIKQEFPSGMFLIQSSPPKTEENYVTMKRDEMYMSSQGQIFASPSAFPVGVYTNKDVMEDTIIRRTRSLIPHSVKCQIIQLAQDNPRITQGEIAQMFGIDRTTVSKILKRRHKFLEESSSEPSTSLSSTPKRSKTETINETLYKFINLWYMEAKKKGENVSQSKIIEMAQSIAKNYGISDITTDNEWLLKFFAKNNVKEADIEDLVKKEDASSSDEILPIYSELPNYLQMQELRETSPKATNLNKTKAGNRTSHTVTSRQHATVSKPPSFASSAVSSSQQGSNTAVSNSRQGTGNKIPRVQTETADTTHEELLEIRKEMDELDTNEALRREIGNLEKFREQQKMMEEANKQRKALLSKTLSERQKKAQEEARKLAHIQREVMILDNLLTADVNVIRSRIEVASREFLDAQKRYERAEKEFIDAKVDLQKKSEMKEHLTEHLYTIIHQNELRKANKLSELMKELEMEQNTESQILPSLPPLSSFNTMSSVHTLYSPKSPPSQDGSHHTVENVKQIDQALNVKSSVTTENVIHIDLTESNTTSDNNDNVKQTEMLENVQQSQFIESEKEDQSSLNSQLNTGEIKNDKLVDDNESASGDGNKNKCGTVSSIAVVNDKGDCNLDEKIVQEPTETDMPSSWTVNIVNLERTSK